MTSKLTVFNLLILLCASTESIIIKSGIARDHSRNSGDDVYDVSSNRGLSVHESDRGFNKDNEGKFITAEDSGRYGQEQADRKHNIDEKNFNSENFKKQSGSDLANNNNQAAHKKGHHKSGFRNSYHKEESGNKSSYYDDNDDQGGHYQQNVRQGDYGDSGASRNRGSYLNGNRYHKDDSKRGNYNNEGLYDKNFGNRRNYNQEKRYDDRSQQGHSNTGNQYGEHGRYEEDRYRKPYYNQELFYPEQDYYQGRHTRPTKTITIYDDPRGYQGGFEYPEYDNYQPRKDYDIVLDVRRPIPLQNRYYGEEPLYQEDYY